jgi:hypothetical protein
MPHVRQQIRSAVAAALAPLGGVHVSRVYPIRTEELPVFLVYNGSERLEGAGFSHLMRGLEIVVEIVVTGDDVDALLDAELVKVETALTGNLGGLVNAFMPSRIETSATAEGSAPIGRARITYGAVYRSNFNPTTFV